MASNWSFFKAKDSVARIGTLNAVVNDGQRRQETRSSAYRKPPNPEENKSLIDSQKTSEMLDHESSPAGDRSRSDLLSMRSEPWAWGQKWEVRRSSFHWQDPGLKGLHGGTTNDPVDASRSKENTINEEDQDGVFGDDLKNEGESVEDPRKGFAAKDTAKKKNPIEGNADRDSFGLGQSSEMSGGDYPDSYWRKDSLICEADSEPGAEATDGGSLNGVDASDIEQLKLLMYIGSPPSLSGVQAQCSLNGDHVIIDVSDIEELDDSTKLLMYTGSSPSLLGVQARIDLPWWSVRRWWEDPVACPGGGCNFTDFTWIVGLLKYCWNSLVALFRTCLCYMALAIFMILIVIWMIKKML